MNSEYNGASPTVRGRNFPLWHWSFPVNVVKDTLLVDAACIAGSNTMVLVLCISCRRTEPLFPRPHGAAKGHYPFMPGAYKAWGYDEIIIYTRPNKFFNSDCAEKVNLLGGYAY